MAATPECLTWTAMSRTINEMKDPASFLVDLMFPDSRSETFPVETVEVGTLVGDREACGFVRVDAEALLVEGVQENLQTITMPNIRLKMAMKASDRLYKRRAGTVIFPSKRQQVSAMEAAVARDLQEMKRRIANRKELMAAQVLTGTLSFQSDEANFRYLTGKPGAHETTASTVWSNSGADPYDEFMTAKELMDDAHSLQPTDVILHPLAAAPFMKLAAVKSDLDTRNYNAGALTTMENIRASGAMYLGILHGIRVWRYGRSVIDHTGSSVPLIRSGYAEFVHAGPEARSQFYYGAIPDEDALDGNLFEGKEFSKSWREPDPSRRIALVHTRPLPVMLRPGAVVSIDVL
jgi:hypothetical protein